MEKENLKTDDDNYRFTKKQIETWREQVKQRRKELFSDLKFDKFGRLAREKL